MVSSPMFKKTPQERISGCQKDILKALKKWNCVLNPKTTIQAGKIDQSINIEALKEENKAKA